jgi:hypothetical protein
MNSFRAMQRLWNRALVGCRHTEVLILFGDRSPLQTSVALEASHRMAGAGTLKPQIDVLSSPSSVNQLLLGRGLEPPSSPALNITYQCLKKSTILFRNVCAVKRTNIRSGKLLKSVLLRGSQKNGIDFRSDT